MSDILYNAAIEYKKLEKTVYKIFKKHGYDYTTGTSKTTTLLIEKEEKGKDKVTIFKNPVYVES